MLRRFKLTFKKNHIDEVLFIYFRVEQEIFLRRSSGDLEGRGSTSARRSFFRRKKHQRNGSRDSKELASFSNVAHPGWCSDSGTLHEDVSLCSYQRVERLDCEYFITNIIIIEFVK